jgi:hypothetical protein
MTATDAETEIRTVATPQSAEMYRPRAALTSPPRGVYKNRPARSAPMYRPRAPQPWATRSLYKSGDVVAWTDPAEIDTATSAWLIRRCHNSHGWEQGSHPS